MSRKVLDKIFYMIRESTKNHLGVPIDKMSSYERGKLGDYILQELYNTYRPSGKVPTVAQEGSKECKQLEEIIAERKKNAQEEMEKIVDRIVQRYRQILEEQKHEKEDLEYLGPFLTPEQRRKKKKREEVVAVAV